MTVLRTYGFPVSTWTRTAHMTCIEQRVEHELVPLTYGGNEHEAMHPLARIPVSNTAGAYADRNP